jgi:hypothetical protein
VAGKPIAFEWTKLVRVNKQSVRGQLPPEPLGNMLSPGFQLGF